MKAVVLQENLHKGLTIASRFVASRVQLPVLSNVLLATEKGRLKISATNLEAGVSVWVGANIVKEGSLTVPSRLLTEYVASLPAGKVELQVKESKLELESGSFRADFQGLSAGEFPALPKTDEKNSLCLSVKLLSETISQVAFAAAADEGRQILTGVLFLVKEGELQVVATDGYRLSLKKIKAEKELTERSELKSGLILPAKTLNEVVRLVSDMTEETVRLSITPESNQVVFGLDEATVASRLIEGDFPDFAKIIPGKGSGVVEIDTEELTRAVKMAAIFARESSNIVRLKAEKSSLKISSNSSQAGGNVSEIEAKIEGKFEGIAFNSRYLLDYLATVSAERLCLEVSGPLHPGVFTSPKDPSFLHLIMPVRVQE